MALSTVTTWDVARTSTAGAPYGDLHSTAVMEQYSVAFLHAIVTRARCKLELTHIDDEQVDGTVRQKASHLVYQRTLVDVQLKCTGKDAIYADGAHVSIKRNQWLGLKEHGYAQKALIVLVVDEDFDKWMTFGIDDILMRGKAFWMNAEDLPDIADGAKSATAIVPLAQEFNVDSLLDMLKRIGDGARL